MVSPASPVITPSSTLNGENAPLLQASPASTVPQRRVSAQIAHRLYISHFLSTWNSGVFEFGAVLYLASIFPGTLLPISIYASTRGVSAVVFAPAVGHYIDISNRLQVVRVSIVCQRLAVAASCVIFYILTLELPSGRVEKMGMLVFLSFFACIEKLCSIMNQVSVEKDWVVIIAENDSKGLKTMNAQMRRIDLMCKIFGPLFIALLAGFSTNVAIIINFTMNCVSVVVEYIAIARVYNEVSALHRCGRRLGPIAGEAEPPHMSVSLLEHAVAHAKAAANRSIADFSFYLHHRSFLPSIAVALLYLTVLSFGSQMTTYLFSAGYSSTQIGIMRMLSVAFEVLSTWVAPCLMGRIGPIRAGLWMSSCQVAMLVVGITVFWLYEDNPLLSVSGLIGGTIFSRLGLRGFDLCVQVIVQEDVEAEHRGQFSSVEAAWQNIFDLISYASTIIYSRPDQFKWPSLISVMAVTTASAAYTTFVYLQRGHLLHLEKMTSLLGSKKVKQREHDRDIERLISPPTPRTTCN